MSIRVVIAGIGNCASALIQGVEYYKDAADNAKVSGLMHVKFGNYHVKDVKFVAGFDVNRLKIGKDLSEAIWMQPNCCAKFADVPKQDAMVFPSPISDGVAAHMRKPFETYDPETKEAADVTKVLIDTKADVLVNFLPVGSAAATRILAQSCLDAGCAFVNGIPEFIASDPEWAKAFEAKGIPVAGDDVKSQLGATIVHRVLTELFIQRGVKVDNTYQLNVGGNTDFLNMTDPGRLTSKKISKTMAIKSLIPYASDVYAGPSGYICHLGDEKVCYIRLNGKKFGDQPVSIDVRLSVQDSPNSAGMVIDVIRAAKIALDRKIGGPLNSISSYAFKHPPIQVADYTAMQWVEEYIQGKRAN